MKRRILFSVIAAAVVTVAGCSVIKNINWNQAKLQNALVNAATAASITDEQVAQLSALTVASLDASNVMEKGAYLTRLKKLMKGVTVDGMTPKLGVYKTDEVNAFACGDGSIRVYTGLMDIMSDNELMAVLGHEIGHVVNKDSKDAMRNAYLTLAAREAIGAASEKAAVLTDSFIGDLAQAYITSQFSQKQELEADDYGFGFAIQQGYDPYSMADALTKLQSLSSGSASTIQQMFSTHPDSALRAKKMREKADAYVAAKK